MSDRPNIIWSNEIWIMRIGGILWQRITQI